MTAETKASVLTRQLTQRFKRYRLVRSVAHRLGQALASRRRVLVGRLETGSRIVLTTADPAHRHIYFYGTYEEDVTAVFHSHVRPGDVVVDVGANVGYFALLSRDLGASVHAFEPNPGMAALIRRSLAMREDGVTLVQQACSSEEGRLPLFLGSGGNMATSSLDAAESGGDGTAVDVPVTTLDAYVRRTGIAPRLVKIDVERHEADFIAGAMETLTSTRPVVIVEMTDSAALEALLSIGYEAWRITPDGLIPTTDLGPDGWANMLLTHADSATQDQSGRNSSS